MTKRKKILSAISPTSSSITRQNNKINKIASSVSKGPVVVVTSKSIIRSAFDICDNEGTNEITISDTVFLFQSLFGMRIISDDIYISLGLKKTPSPSKRQRRYDSTAEQNTTTSSNNLIVQKVYEGYSHHVPPSTENIKDQQQKISYDIFCAMIPDDVIEKLDEDNGNALIKDLYEVVAPPMVVHNNNNNKRSYIDTAHVKQLLKEVQDVDDHVVKVTTDDDNDTSITCQQMIDEFTSNNNNKHHSSSRTSSKKKGKMNEKDFHHMMQTALS